MIGKSLPEYVFIRVCIFSLRAIAPASIGYLAACAYWGRILVSPWLLGYAAVEAGFYTFVYLPRMAFLQSPAVHPPLIPREERERLFTHCFELVRDTSAITGWFYHTSIDSLYRENVVDWILWAFFSANSEQHDEIMETWHEEIDGYIQRVENVIGHAFPPGRNPQVKAMRVSLDPVVAAHRPLIWYMIVSIVDNLTYLIFAHLLKLKHVATKKWLDVFPPRPLTLLSKRGPLHPQLSYWYRPHLSTTREPIVFLHGLGIGLWPYAAFFRDIIRDDPDVGIIALEFMPASMRITSRPLSHRALCVALENILDAHGFDKFVLAGHSYGTVLSASILRSEALGHRVSGSVLIDAIPFLLTHPAVAYNFVYRPPKEANEWQLWYFASRDPDIARTLARHFFWSECIMFRTELENRKTAVVLCEEDQIVAAQEVWRYLTEEDTDHPPEKWTRGGLQVFFVPGLDHAVIFDKPEQRRMLVGLLREFGTRDEQVQVPTEGGLVDVD